MLRILAKMWNCDEVQVDEWRLARHALKCCSLKHAQLTMPACIRDIGAALAGLTGLVRGVLCWVIRLPCILAVCSLASLQGVEVPQDVIQRCLSLCVAGPKKSGRPAGCPTRPGCECRAHFGWPWVVVLTKQSFNLTIWGRGLVAGPPAESGLVATTAHRASSKAADSMPETSQRTPATRYLQWCWPAKHDGWLGCPRPGCPRVLCGHLWEMENELTLYCMLVPADPAGPAIAGLDTTICSGGYADSAGPAIADRRQKSGGMWQCGPADPAGPSLPDCIVCPQAWLWEHKRTAHDQYDLADHHHADNTYHDGQADSDQASHADGPAGTDNRY